MFRNPISNKRLQFLTNQLQKKLAKQPDLLQRTLPKLQHLAAADPSVSGEYSTWILRLLLKKDIDLPEDAGKLYELLETFHKVKQRLPQEFRDINKFVSYSQLRITLLPMLPTLKSMSELQLEGTQLIASETLGDAIYQIYKLTTPEAASLAAKGSGWCVCNETTAKNYLEDGPLYLFVRNDKRHALGHVPSYQLMDVNDVPIRPIESDHHYDDMIKLLDKHLPELLCDDQEQHQKFLKGKKPTGQIIANIVCHNCDEAACFDCGAAICNIADDCNKGMCLKHKEVCEDCDKAMCGEHTLSCCRYSQKEESKCTDCASTCARCEEKICDQCSRFVECCNETLCESHSSGYCNGCDNSMCDQHSQNMAKCGSCDYDQYYCEDCREDWIACDQCSEYCCENCSFDCHCCNDRSCKACSEVCGNCDNRVCYNCNNNCHKCRENYCDDCPEGKCGGSKPYRDQRPHHFHGDTSQCIMGQDDTEAGCFDTDFCQDCIFRCMKCDDQLCGEHIKACGCDGDHPICESCSLTNHCTGCGGTFCNPEEHIQCAYIRRKLRRRR